MVRTSILALIGATALFSTAAIAADLPPPLPMPMVQPVPVAVGGWYLRADVGVGQKSFSDFQHHQTNPVFVWPASWRIDQKDMADTAFVGFGIGYAWNNWLRFDVTGEYRMKEAFKVIGSYTEFCPAGRCFDVYEGHHSNWLVLANAYIDLGTWWCLTPFVGAGIGTAYHKFTGLMDVGYITGPGTTGFGYASSDSSKWSMAWALHAGVAYNVTNNFKVELGYRYVNMGSIDTPVIDCAGGGCAGNGPRAYYSFTNYYSQDLKLGMRWMLQPETPAYLPPPVMRKG